MPTTRNDRRRFLAYWTDALLAVIGALLGIPVIGYICAPFWRKEGGEPAGTSFADLGPVSALPVGKWQLVTLKVVSQDGWTKGQEQHAVWVRRQENAEHEVEVLSPLCPHLGCPINWFPDKAEFMCPCHGGVFNANGEHLTGPPPRSMDQLPFEVRAGHLWVRWEEFKIGVAQRILVRT